jgi:cytochrome c-type biogenesis protein CcmH/NrfG
MTDQSRIRRKQWNVKPAIILAAVSLTVGIAGGWSIRAWQSPTGSGPAQPGGIERTAGNSASSVSQTPSPAQLLAMADAQAAPQLAKLKSDPNNADLLTSIGNVYYDAQQYPAAVDYYGRALKSRPSDAAVRTDMGTAYWYMGNADSAIAEFNKALTYAPTNPNTLFNLGLVKLQGKKDSAGAITDWEKLLAANPNYEGKDKVVQMMTEAKKQSAVKP